MRPLRAINWRTHKKGCTGKVYYAEANYARSTAYLLYERGADVIAQVYKCSHCDGYHVTGHARKIWMTCPVQPVHEVHVFKLRRLSGVAGVREIVASCIHCAVRIQDFAVLDKESRALLAAAEPDTPFKTGFVQALLSRHNVVVNKCQIALIEHILKPKELLCG